MANLHSGGNTGYQRGVPDNRDLASLLASIDKKIRLLDESLSCKLTLINNSIIKGYKTVIDTELCLPNGDIVIRREVIDIITGDTLIRKYLTLSGNNYTGDLSQLDNMICCCNKPAELITEFFEPLENTNSIVLANIPDLTKELEVERSGIPLEINVDFTVSSNVITFTEPFIASNGAVYSITIKVEYYKL